MTAVLTGDWIAGHTRLVGDELASALRNVKRFNLDLTRIQRLDSAGALSILHALGDRLNLANLPARPETSRFLALIDHAQRAPRSPSIRHALESPASALGRAVISLASALSETFAFSGHVAGGIARCLAHPRQIRWAAWITHAQRAGIDAIPIIAVTSFFVGAVVGLLGVHMLQQFGAQVFAVELIGVAVLREFGVIITAVLLAGRSASAFAAEIGSMQMQQEVDAMRVMGVNPIDALVVPRLGALLLMTPLLTFAAMISGLLGGLLVTWSALDLAPAFFLQRIVDNVGAAHFWVGMSKAPLMAAVIAGIGCHQGLEVGGDVESLGRRVTTAVVRAIFAIIAIDAAFALVYMELDI